MIRRDYGYVYLHVQCTTKIKTKRERFRRHANMARLAAPRPYAPRHEEGTLQVSRRRGPDRRRSSFLNVVRSRSLDLQKQRRRLGGARGVVRVVPLRAHRDEARDVEA
jgi:hypothetical protein